MSTNSSCIDVKRFRAEKECAHKAARAFNDWVAREHPEIVSRENTEEIVKYTVIEVRYRRKPS